MRRFILALLLCAPCIAQDYYVDPSAGDDAADGLTFGNAWKTTQKALDTADVGDVVALCKTATETTSVAIDADYTTPAVNDVTFIHFVSYNSAGSAAEDGYTIQASGAGITNGLINYAGADQHHWTGVIFDGENIADNCLFNDVSGSDDNVFIRCRFTDAQEDGIEVEGNPSQWVFIDCEVDANRGNGILHNATARGEIFFLGGKIHDNTNDGWIINRTNCYLIGAQVYDNGANGVHFDSSADACTIIGNTIYGNTSDGVEFHALSSRDEFIIIGNSVVGNGAYGFFFGQDDTDVARVFDWNHTDGNVTAASDKTLPGDNNITGDPLFTSVTDGSEDFTPLTGSPLIGALYNGANIGAVAHADGGGSTVIVIMED